MSGGGSRKPKMRWVWADAAVHVALLSGAAVSIRDQTLFVATGLFSSSLLDCNRNAYLKRLIIRWGGTVILASINTLFKVLWTYYVKDENDTGSFGTTSEFATPGDIRRDIIHQDQRTFISPAIGTFNLAAVGGEGEVVHDFRTVRKLGIADQVICTVGLYQQVAGGWQLASVVGAPNTLALDGTMRMGLSVPP